MTIFVRKPNKKDWLVRPILNEKRETRLELATACLEENLPQEIFGNSWIGSNGRSRAFSWYASSPDKSTCRAKYKSFCYLKAISTAILCLVYSLLVKKQAIRCRNKQNSPIRSSLANLQILSVATSSCHVPF